MLQLVNGTPITDNWPSYFFIFFFCGKPGSCYFTAAPLYFRGFDSAVKDYAKV